MSRDELREASRLLKEASAAADDDEHRQRLYDQSDQFADHAEADRGPDHGRLARHELKLSEIADEAGGEVAESIEEALEHVRAYRETVEGV